MALLLDQQTLPTHWAPAIMYGDLGGLDDDDCEAIRRFVTDMVNMYGKCWCVEVDGDMGFVRYHDAARYNVLACDCSLYTFDIT